MLKKIALAALFAITFAAAAAQAKTSVIHTPDSPIVPQGICGKGLPC